MSDPVDSKLAGRVAFTYPDFTLYELARFFIVSLVGLAFNLVLLELFVTSVGMPDLAAQALAVALVTPVNFVGNKLWSFRRR